MKKLLSFKFFNMPRLAGRASRYVISWWNWEDERIRKSLHLITSDDIETFIINEMGNNWKNKI